MAMKIFQVIDDYGYIASSTKDPQFIDVRGQFKNGGKVSGTLTITGSEWGPASPPYYEPPEYQNFTSGTLHWSAHKVG